MIYKHVFIETKLVGESSFMESCRNREIRMVLEKTIDDVVGEKSWVFITLTKVTDGLYVAIFGKNI